MGRSKIGPSLFSEQASMEREAGLEDREQELHDAQRDDHASEERHGATNRDTVVAGALEGAHPERCAAGARRGSQSQSNESYSHCRSLVSAVTPRCLCYPVRGRRSTLAFVHLRLANAAAEAKTYAHDTHSQHDCATNGIRLKCSAKSRESARKQRLS